MIKKYLRLFTLFFGLMMTTISYAAITNNPEINSVVEKNKISIAVGGQNLFYYLPLTIADRLGYFRDEGLTVEISDFAGGGKALQAMIGGSSDVVAGAYEHTLKMQVKKQSLTAFVLMNTAPQIVMAVSRKTLPNYQQVSDLKGKKIGISAPGSSTNMLANFVLAKAGMRPDDVSYIGVGTSAGAVAALRAGRIDAIVNTDPVIALLEQHHEITLIADTRSEQGTKAIFGGQMPAGALYSKSEFIAANPHTIQALTNAMVRALHWLQKASPQEVSRVVPASYLLNDVALYQQAFAKNRATLSTSGYFSPSGPERLLAVLKSYDPDVAAADIHLATTWTNQFAARANDKYK